MLQASVRLYKNAYQGLSRPIWWLALVMLVNRSGTMVIPFLTVYLTEKGYTLGQAGFIMALFGAGAIVGSFLGGKLTDKIGFYYVQFLSLLLNGVLFIVLGAMHTLWQIGACIFLLSSLGEAFRPANAAAIAAYSNESNRTRCYSLNRLAVNLGWAIGPAVGGILASFNYKWLFWVDGSTCIIASLLLFIFLPPEKTPATAVLNNSPLTVEKNSAYKDAFFLKVLFFLFFISICFFQHFSLVPVFYKEAVHLSKATIGLVLALNGIIIALVEMVLVYTLENKRHALQYMVAGSLLTAFSFFVLHLATSLSLVLISMVLVTFGEMLLFPFANSFWVTRTTPQNRGQYAGAFNINFALAQILAPTLAAQIALWFDFYTLWMVDAVICIFAAAGFFFLQKRFQIHE